jgi:hypothetical protein
MRNRLTVYAPSVIEVGKAAAARTRSSGYNDKSHGFVENRLSENDDENRRDQHGTEHHDEGLARA